MPGLLRRAAQRSPLAVFSCLAVGLGWLVGLPMVLSPAGLGLVPIPLPEIWLILVACTPTAAALWTQWLVDGDFRIARLGSPWPRAISAGVLGVVVVGSACAIVPALVLSNGAVSALHWSALVTASAPWWINPLNLLGGPLNEEPGWRGFALPRLQSRYGALGASLLLAALWFAWHVPLFLLKGWLSVPLWAYGTLLVCLSLLMTWVVNVSGGSVLPAMLMHAVFNSSFPVLSGLCQGLDTRRPGLTWYIAGVVAATLVVVAATRGRLGRDHPTARPPA